MKKYIAKEIERLLKSKDRKVEIKLKNKNDWKKNPLRRCYNRFILTIQKKIVPSHIKNLILRTTGMKIGYDVCIPHDITFDYEFPELIILRDGCLIGGLSSMITHEIKGNKLILGKVTVCKRVLVGGDSVLYPGTKVNQKSILALPSVVYGDIVPEGELWMGDPAKCIKKFDEKDIEKYFKPSDGNYKKYYREFRKKVNEFLKDKNNYYFKIYYNGKRLNAGMDWWRARSLWKIWFNGAIVEFTRLLPHSWIKTMLLRLMGVKIGKNVYIGKGTVFDHIYGDLVTVEDNVRIGNNCYFDGHSYTITQTVFGRIRVGKNVVLEDNVYVALGTKIGENTLIKKNSMCSREIPPNEIWEGIPAKKIGENK